MHLITSRLWPLLECNVYLYYFRWSYGVVLWEIQTRGEILFLGGLFLLRKTFSNGCFLSSVSGQVPYVALGGQEIVQKLRRGERLPKPDGCSDEMYVFFIKTRISFVFSYLRKVEDYKNIFIFFIF